MDHTSFTFEEYIKEKLESIDSRIKELNGKTVTLSDYYIRNSDLPDKVHLVKTEFYTFKEDILNKLSEFKAEISNKINYGEVTKFKIKVIWGIGGVIFSAGITLLATFLSGKIL